MEGVFADELGVHAHAAHGGEVGAAGDQFVGLAHQFFGDFGHR